MNLCEAVNHAKLLKELDCKLCGIIYKDKINIIAILRTINHYCVFCNTYHNQTIDELLK